MNWHIFLSPYCWLQELRWNFPAILRGQFDYPISGHVFEFAATRYEGDKIIHDERCMVCHKPGFVWHHKEMADVWPCCHE